jgi:hypothetical protein
MCLCTYYNISFASENEHGGTGAYSCEVFIGNNSLCLKLSLDINFIIYCFPVYKVCLISATLPHEILEMTSKFMTDPVRILVKRDELTLEVNIIAGLLYHFLCGSLIF